MLDRARAQGSARSAVPVRRLPPASDLVDRDAELDLLIQAWGDARAGRARVVVIEAEAGMGKSALLQDFAGRLDHGSVHWLRCDEFERDITFAGAERLLGARIRLAGYSEIEVGRRLLAWLGESQQRTGAVLIAVDDVQWLDPPSSRSLTFALRRLRADRVLVIFARRPGGSSFGSVLTEDPAATSTLRLGPLTSEAVATLARRLRSWELPPTRASELVARTHGVPLLVAEAIRGAADPAALSGSHGVTSSVSTVAARMLAPVEPDTRAVVEAAAVFAEPADLVLLGLLAEIDDPAEATARAVGAGLLRVEDDLVACAHDLLQDAIYRGLRLPRRRELHRRAATLTLGDRRLAHLTAARDRPDPELVDELIEAARVARRLQRYGLAAAHRLRARTVCGDPELRNRMLLEAILDRVSAQDLVGADELARQVDPEAGGALRPLALGLLAREAGRIQPARQLLREALDRAIAEPDGELTAAAGVAKAVLDVRLNDGAAAAESAGWALDSADPELAADARTNQALAWWQRGEFDRALAVLDGAISPAADAPWDADIIGVQGVVRLYSGRWPEALADFEAAVALDPVWRPSTNHCQSRTLRAKTRILLGDWDGAAVDCAVARTLAKSGAQVWNIPLAYGQSADVPAWRGQFETAAGYLAEVDASLRVLVQAQVQDAVVDHRLTLAMARDDPAAVIDVLTPLWSTDYLERVGTFRVHRWSQQCWLLAHLERGDLAEAERALDRYQATLERWPGGIVPRRLDYLRGRLAEARGEPVAAREHYAAELLGPETRQTPYFLAESLFNLGRLERALGNRREAVEHLGRAREIFAGLRAAPAETRCTAELAACGLQVTLSDPLRLTPREEDVASLVARGYANKEVAAELYLTPKTVEFHLGKIYAKLGIRTRGELRRLRTGH